MNKLYILIYCSCLIILLSACSSYNVIHVTDNNKEKLLHKQGFYYDLPMTALKIDVTVREHRKVKGPYSDYAEKYLGLKNIIKSNSYNYEMLNVKVNSFVMRDPDQFYFVESAGSGKKHNNMLVTLSNDGFLESINSADYKESANNKTFTLNQNMPEPENASEHIVEGNLREKIDTIIEKIKTSDTMSIEKKIYKKTYVEKTLEQKARDAADYIMKIKTDRYDLLVNLAELTYSKETIAYMKEQLDKLEDEYLSYFTGDTSSTLLHYTFTYIPNNTELANEAPLFVFSPKEGIMKTPDATGEVVAISVVKNTETSKVNQFQSQIDNKPSSNNGFSYRIPETAKVSIFKNKILLSETTLPICQFGLISHLPLNIKNVILSPVTGSVKRIQE